tara:strand:+ start:333 stop:572 length:240 start_codon:yes stop_codon:yes gene_type:complete
MTTNKTDSQVLLMLGELKGTTQAIHDRLDSMDAKATTHDREIKALNEMSVINKTKLGLYGTTAGVVGGAALVFVKKIFE